MGQLILARMEGRLAPHLARKWRIDRPLPPLDDDRHGMGRQPLVLTHLATEAELGAL